MNFVPIQLLRVALGILAVFFAYVLGRVSARLRRQKLPYSKAITWILRTAVCVLGVLWRRGFDAVSIGTLALAVAGFALGALLEYRPRHTEEVHLFRE